VLTCAAPRAKSDLIHLQGGFTIETQSIEDRGNEYRVKTRQGTYDIEKTRVTKIEAGPGPGDIYEQERTHYKDTAPDQFALPQWCAFHGLASERLIHLKRAIELDPEHAPARNELGYAKKNGRWVKDKPANAPTDAQLAAKHSAKAQEAEIRARVSGWFVKI